MDNFEDHLNSIRTEWNAVKEKWFHGEQIDPVFEGVVRDFINFDETMHAIFQKVGNFMRGVESLSQGIIVLSEGVADGLKTAEDSAIASDSCKLKEAANQIGRADAPHSAIAKLRRDMHFNILNPVQNHIANNRNLKVSLDIRRRRLIELNAAKKTYDDCVKRKLAASDSRLLKAQSSLESAKMTFNDVDRHVFEWLYILAEYRGDILDSTLQTLKYLQYEYFATAAHAISSSLPARMEFRPMVEMTPEHLEAQVEMELQASEELVETGDVEKVPDFSLRLIDKKAREEPAEAELPALPVDPLSLSSLLSQGFEEGPARRALRLHQNNTQEALDWLVNGGTEAETKAKQERVQDSVRMPTTVKRVQKLKALRKSQADKQRRDKEGGAGDRASEDSSSRRSGSRDEEEERDRDREARQRDRERRREKERAAEAHKAKADAAPNLMDQSLMDFSEPSSAAAGSAGAPDLLSLGEEPPPPPTDFGGEVRTIALPEMHSFDTSRCTKGPLSSSVAAGTAPNRGVDMGGGADVDVLLGLGPSAPAAAPSNDIMAQVQALAAKTGVSPEQLLAAAQQLNGQQAAAPAPPVPPAPAPAPAAAAPASGGWGNFLTPTAGPGNGYPGMGMQAPAPSPAAKDPLDQLVNFTS